MVKGGYRGKRGKGEDKEEDGRRKGRIREKGRMEDKGQEGKRKGGMEGIGKRERNGHQERAYKE